MRQEIIEKIGTDEYDLLVVGGGIFGAAALREATLRGMKAALIEATDFAHGSSANSYKVIHGGLRYMQHLDIPRVLSSSRERSSFLRIAPHLCQPLPIIIPTYGLGKLGKPFLGAGCIAYDFITALRNKSIGDESRQIPLTKFLSREQVLAEYPDIDAEGLTGGCVFNDGRFYNPTRLVWAFIETAIEEGADAVNYLRAESLVLDGQIVQGVVAVDQLTNKKVSIKAKCVLNTAGPWAEQWLSDVTNGRFKPTGVYSRDACFVVKRKFESNYTLAVQGESADPDALLAREKRHLFLAPWRNYTLVGVWHKVTKMRPEEVTVTDEELAIYLNEINGSYPHLKLTIDDVLMWNAGLVPFGEDQSSDENLSYGKRSNLIDHSRTEKLDNFISLIGLRYTMARGEAEKALNLAQKKLGLPRCSYQSDFQKLCSAQFDRFDTLCEQLSNQAGNVLSDTVIDAMAHNYGSKARLIIEAINSAPELAEVVENTTVTLAEVEYVCANEMVETFADLVYRRTDVATGGNPGDTVLLKLLQRFAELKKWDQDRCESELAGVKARLR